MIQEYYIIYTLTYPNKSSFIQKYKYIYGVCVCVCVQKILFHVILYCYTMICKIIYGIIQKYLFLNMK